jgi:hypothetical protein
MFCYKCRSLAQFDADGIRHSDLAQIGDVRPQQIFTALSRLTGPSIPEPDKD